MTYNSTSSNNHAALYSLPCAFSSSNLLHISSSNRASIPFICGKQQGAFLLSKTRIRYPHTAPTVKMSSSETSIPFVIAESDSTHKIISLTSSDGAEIKAYLATPPDITSVNGRGVILMTDVLGYENPDTRAVARLLASRGLPTSTLTYPSKLHHT